MTKKKANGRTLGVYKSYVFRDKDPVIDTMRTWVQDSKKSYTDIHANSGVAVATMRGWFHGKTRRPNFCTVAATARALGKNSIPLK
jgi:hypothetical protein